MRKLTAALAVLMSALVLGSTASAAVVPYLVRSVWSTGQGGGSAFSSSWFMNVMGKAAPFDTTITFIDNVSYGWHSTRRGSDAYLSTHWLTSQVKKAHCHSNVTRSIYASCTVYS